MSKFSIISEEVLIDQFVHVKKQTLVYDKNHVQDYYTVSTKPQAVSILAFTKNDTILTTREYRLAIQQTVIGLPGGLVDIGEDVLTAAKRELKEETGYQAKHLSHLGTVYQVPGLYTQSLSLFIAHTLTKLGPAQLEISEDIELIEMTIDEIRAMDSQNCAIDGSLFTALGLYFLKKMSH